MRESEPERPSDSELFRQAFRRYATTVVLVTYTDSDGRPSGLTATSMCSLSPSPPSLLVCINRSTRAYSEITARGLYGVNILSVGQRSVALHCSRPGMDKTLLPEWLVTDGAERPTPRLKGSLAHLECTVDTSYEAYSHHVFLGLIQEVWLNPIQDPPLLYHGGAYGQLESAAELTERFHWELPG
jgi:3-hydroxy-9,10-secoandrosta-1,3,5(10)-triene-9,17-dione monooxygenase reductase component